MCDLLHFQLESIVGAQRLQYGSLEVSTLSLPVSSPTRLHQQSCAWMASVTLNSTVCHGGATWCLLIQLRPAFDTCSEADLHPRAG